MELATILSIVSLALNVLFLYLLKFTNVMRGPIGYTGAQGNRGEQGVCTCKCK